MHLGSKGSGLLVCVTVWCQSFGSTGFVGSFSGLGYYNEAYNQGSATVWAAGLLPIQYIGLLCGLWCDQSKCLGDLDSISRTVYVLGL